MPSKATIAIVNMLGGADTDDFGRESVGLCAGLFADLCPMAQLYRILSIGPLLVNVTGIENESYELRCGSN
jgi:hypothetical protein